MEAAARHDILQRLGEAMTDLQEACYCAQWMCVTPTIVGLCRKAITTGMPVKWGIGELSVSCARELWAMAENAGGWAEPDWSGDDATYVVGWPYRSLEAAPLDGEELNFGE